MTLGGRQDVELDAAGQQGVGRLLGAEALEVAITCSPLRSTIWLPEYDEDPM